MEPRSSAERPATRGLITHALKPELWLLDPDVVHLNHGSYGAVPTPVLAVQRLAAESVERSPERFYRTDLAPAVDAVRRRVAAWLNVDTDGLALVQNATEAMQVALESVRLGPGAEVVYTDHAYPWVKAAIARACAERGAVAHSVPLPDPTGVTDAEFTEALVADLSGAVNERTALLVLDQITSASALRLPVEAVCAALGSQVPILVDGAHAPGLVDSPVPVGAAFWLGNLHKWAFAARTAAALVVAPHWRERVQPLVASAGAWRGYPGSFTYLGTQDATAYLALPAALDFPSEHLGMTFRELRERNAAVLNLGVQRLTAALGIPQPAAARLPMQAVPLGVDGGEVQAAGLGDRLRELGVEVAITSVSQQLHARVSVQAYVGVAAFERLAAALREVG